MGWRRESRWLGFAVLALSFVSALGQETAANPAIVPVGRTATWWVERHQHKVAEARAGGVDLLFVGDSITQNYEKPGPPPNEVFLPTWNKLFAPHHAMNLGFSGDLTQQVLWRLDHSEVDGLAPKDIVLLVGANNTNSGETAEQTAPGVIAVVENLHRRMPGAKILLIEILPSAVSEEKSKADAAVNATVRTHYADSKFLRSLDLHAIFIKDGRLDTTLFYDSLLEPPRPPLHPNTMAQRQMAEAVSKALYE